MQIFCYSAGKIEVKTFIFGKSDIYIPGRITDLHIFPQFFYRDIDIPATGRSFETAGKITKMNASARSMRYEFSINIAAVNAATTCSGPDITFQVFQIQ